jgi:hypothetical protein
VIGAGHSVRRTDLGATILTFRGVKATSAQLQAALEEPARQVVNTPEQRRETGIAHAVMLNWAAIGGMAIVMALSGCTGSSPKSHTAMQLAHEITGCTQFFRQPPASHATQDVVCPLPDYALVEITTFKTGRDEWLWLAERQIAKCPRPVIEGHLWVARLTKGPVMKSDIFLINSSIGGRVVIPKVSNSALSCSS